MRDLCTLYLTHQPSNKATMAAKTTSQNILKIHHTLRHTQTHIHTQPETETRATRAFKNRNGCAQHIQRRDCGTDGLCELCVRIWIYMRPRCMALGFGLVVSPRADESMNDGVQLDKYNTHAYAPYHMSERKELPQWNRAAFQDIARRVSMWRTPSMWVAQKWLCERRLYQHTRTRIGARCCWLEHKKRV